MKRVLHFLFIMALAYPGLCTTPSRGNPQPTLIQGYVKDAHTKKPVAGVTVFASVPGSAKSIEAVTDAEGFYHFSELPACQVNLQFGKKGYQQLKKAGIQVNEKVTLSLDIDFYRDANESFPSSPLLDKAEHPLLQILDI